MKRLLVFLLCLFVFYCAGTKPPPPPPIEVCGNQRCVPPEDFNNCPADCPELPPPPTCDKDNQCEPARGETPENCSDCVVAPKCGDDKCNGNETPATCPKDCEEPPKPQLNKERLVCFGQYVQFIQKIDWAEVANGIRDIGYNCGSWHITSAWGANEKMWPWVWDGSKFDLSKPNPDYEKHFESFLDYMGRNDITIEISLHDGYYTDSWASKGAAKKHPYRNNKQGINWGDDELGLPEGKPWFNSHIAWKTTGTGFNEYVSDYTIQPKFKWLWDFHRYVGQSIKNAKGKYPGMEAVMVRYINENHARFDSNGQHTGGFGGEDKIFQIVRMEWEKLGLKHGKDFVIVNDWMPFIGVEFQPKEWARAGQFDRQPRHRWLREVHGNDEQQINQLKQVAALYPAYADLKFTIVSTDGFRPEDGGFIKSMNRIYKMKLPILDVKVPSESAVNNGTPIYFDQDYMKTYRAVLPVMRRILQ